MVDISRGPRDNERNKSARIIIFESFHKRRATNLQVLANAFLSPSLSSNLTRDTLEIRDIARERDTYVRVKESIVRGEKKKKVRAADDTQRTFDDRPRKRRARSANQSKGERTKTDDIRRDTWMIQRREIFSKNEEIVR